MIGRAFRDGTVIPAHPLALTADRRLDERRQRALTRYYLRAGARGLAVGVHTTQFQIHEPRVGLLQPVLELAALEARDVRWSGGADVVLIAGAIGPTTQAVAEADLARSVGYHAVLLAPDTTLDETGLLDRAQAVGEVLPVIGFYLQPAVGGRLLSESFWRRLAALPAVVGIKVAPFNRYLTTDVMRGVAASGRASEVSLYTGNDDHIAVDLVSQFAFEDEVRQKPLQFVGGLLGQWAMWTRCAVELLADAHRAGNGDDQALRRVIATDGPLTDANSAIFDFANAFRGCIPGIHEVLRRSGLLAGRWCLDPREELSPGQLGEIDRIFRVHPSLRDDEFVGRHLDEWLA